MGSRWSLLSIFVAGLILISPLPERAVSALIARSAPPAATAPEPGSRETPKKGAESPPTAPDAGKPEVQANDLQRQKLPSPWPTVLLLNEKLGEALIVAAVLGFAVDEAIKRSLVTEITRDVLDFAVGDHSVDGGGLGVDGRRHRSVNVDGRRFGADVELNVESVRLLGNQVEVVEDFLLKSVRFHFQLERYGGGKCVEVEHAGVVAGPDLLFVGCGIGQRKGGARNYCARGISHHALNGSSVLRLDQRGRCNDADDQQCDADCQTRTPHGVSSNRKSAVFQCKLRYLANHGPTRLLNLWKSDLVNNRRMLIARLNFGGQAPTWHAPSGAIYLCIYGNAEASMKNDRSVNAFVCP